MTLPRQGLARARGTATGTFMALSAALVLALPAPAAAQTVKAEDLVGSWGTQGLVGVVYTYKADGTFIYWPRSKPDGKQPGTWQLKGDTLMRAIRGLYGRAPATISIKNGRLVERLVPGEKANFLIETSLTTYERVDSLMKAAGGTIPIPKAADSLKTGK